MSSTSGPAPRLACRPLPQERLLLPSVHLFDPAHGVDRVADLLIDGGAIAALGDDLVAPVGVEVLTDLQGCWVFPGFVDPHAHLRTPGQEYKEDVISASRAAAAGGFVVVVGMANTEPPVDVGPLASWVLDQAAVGADVLVGQVGAVSRGLEGQALAELRELCDAGVVAFSDDGRPVNSANLLLHALRYLRGTGRPVLLHLEDRSLSAAGVIHEGRWSARLGLRGIPTASETGPLARDLEIVAYAAREEERQAEADGGGPRSMADGQAARPPLVHFQHLSCAQSVHLVRAAKNDGLPISCEVTPHHLVLTDEAVQSFDQSLKVNPPLRCQEARRALVAALADGTVDCVGTDHAPHAPHEKEVPFEEAPFGTVGLETAFAVLHDALIVPGDVSLGRLIDAMSSAPSRVLRVEAPRLEVGAPARFCVADLDEEWTVTTADLRGKCRNSAFLGRKVRGRVVLTVVDGARRFSRERREAGRV